MALGLPISDGESRSTSPVLDRLPCGVGYAIDLGVGPALIAAVGLLVIYQTRSIGAVTALVGGMLPIMLVHHGVNFAVGGTLGPANANAAYFNWPGCSFNSQNMTGGWHHSSFGNFLLYAASLLFGKRGFIGHNLPLFLLFPEPSISCGNACVSRRSSASPCSGAS